AEAALRGWLSRTQAGHRRSEPRRHPGSRLAHHLRLPEPDTERHQHRRAHHLRWHHAQLYDTDPVTAEREAELRRESPNRDERMVGGASSVAIRSEFTVTRQIDPSPDRSTSV